METGRIWHMRFFFRFIFDVSTHRISPLDLFRMHQINSIQTPHHASKVRRDENHLHSLVGCASRSRASSRGPWNYATTIRFDGSYLIPYYCGVENTPLR